MMSAAASVGIENIRAMRARLLDVTYIIDLHKSRIITSGSTSKYYTTKCFKYQKSQLHYSFSITHIKFYCNLLGHILSIF